MMRLSSEIGEWHLSVKIMLDSMHVPKGTMNFQVLCFYKPFNLKFSFLVGGNKKRIRTLITNRPMRIVIWLSTEYRP